MIVALYAALAMVAQDIFATLLVQCEARNRAALAGLLDMAGWLCTLLTLSFSIGSIQHHGWNATTFVIVASVSVSNFVGTFVGTRIGKRWIKVEELNV